MTKMASEAALALERRVVDRLRRFPREPDVIIYSFRSVIALIIRALLRVYLRFEIVGGENLPNEESFVLVANHSSHLDTLCLLAALPLGRLHRAFPVAAEDYFFRSLPRTWFAAVAMNALPFARQMRVRESLLICAQLLAQPGTVLIIFPEGTRSRTGATQPFKPGVGALLAGRDVAVLPCHVQGAFRAWPKGRRFPRPRKVRLIIGSARNFSGRGTGRSEVSAIARELQQAVEELGERNGRA
ncbi:MAG: lysophospholipid acyltransferase family protein [Chthoniobacterales bacterium]